MKTQELHIRLDIELQKISSNWNKNFLPQEKDIALNKEITKFVKQRTNPLSNNKRLSTFDTIKRVQDLDSLFETVPLTVIPINEKEVGIQLPFDFLYYISSEVQVEPTCKSKVIPTIPKIFYSRSFPALKDTSSISSCTLILTDNEAVNHTLFNHTLLPLQYLPQDSIENYKKDFIYNNAILALSLRNIPKGYEIRFNNKTQKFEVKSEKAFTLVLTVDASIEVITSNDLTVSVPKELKGLVTHLDVIDEEFKTLAQGSHLSSTKGKKVNGYLRADLILIPISPSVLAKRVFLTYIRKPFEVDLLLDCDSDLPDEVLDEIVANTAESLKAVLSSDTYQTYKDNNSLIE